MTLDIVVAACLVPLALWLLVSGLDDFFISLLFLAGKRPRVRVPDAAGLAAAPHRRIAVFVPLWHEHAVIGRMLEHNISVIGYTNYDFFVGVYPNDSATLSAVSAVRARHPHVHLAVCPHDGPTSKADCLNSIYRAMADWERQQGVRFDLIVTHDAEDLIHPRAFSLIDYFCQEYDMVQIPVLPLPTPLSHWTHGLYCDEFAEYQTKDIPIRQATGGFLPSNGVGTGFSRRVLEDLARGRGGQIFVPECLTEDYENGFLIHAMGRPQLFVPVRFEAGAPVATREYFPGTLRSALRQRTRWVTGIALQGWQRHGWRVPPRQVYYFWRDRKGLIGNLLSPLANLIWLDGLYEWARFSWGGPGWELVRLMPPWVSALWGVTMAVSLVTLAVRAGCVARIYGFRFALGVPLRAILGNWLNCAATVVALQQFLAARLRHAVPAWLKTDHVYPDGAGLRAHKPRLGEVLVRMRCVTAGDVDAALTSRPAGTRIGEHLVHLQKVSEANLCEALSLQYGLPLAPAVLAEAVRALPAEVARRWKVLPVRVESGQLHLAVADLPGPAITRELRRYSTLEIRCCLLPPKRLDSLVTAYLQSVPAGSESEG